MAAFCGGPCNPACLSKGLREWGEAYWESVAFPSTNSSCGFASSHATALFRQFARYWRATFIEGGPPENPAQYAYALFLYLRRTVEFVREFFVVVAA